MFTIHFHTNSIFYNHSCKHFIEIHILFIFTLYTVPVRISTVIKNNNQCSFSYLTIYLIQCCLSQKNRIKSLCCALFIYRTVESCFRQRQTDRRVFTCKVVSHYTRSKLSISLIYCILPVDTFGPNRSQHTIPCQSRIPRKVLK